MPYHVTIPEPGPVDGVRPMWERYGVAVLACAAALSIRSALHPMVGGAFPFLLLPAATMVAAWFGGVGPGILAALVGAVAAQYAWITPGSLTSWNRADIVALTAYLVSSAIAIWIIARMRSAEHKAKVDAARRRASEWALQESQRRLEIAIESTSLGWFDWDVVTGVLKWSAETRTIFGVAPDEEVTFERFLSLVHPDDRAHADATGHAAMDCGSSGRYSDQFRIVRPDGAIRWITARGQVTFTPEPDRRAVGFVGTVLDITEQKLAEHALVNAEKFAATGRLAASIAHEINNPLESVTNLLYLLEGAEDDRQRAQFLALAQQELGRASRVAAQMLRFYREDKLMAPAQVADILDSVVRDFSPRLGKEGISLRREYDDELAMLQCFGGELRQVFNNLMQNAIDASAAGSTIVVRARESSDWSRKGGRGLRLTFADQGTGMQAQTRQRLFEPFFTTKGTAGTGLGLWISKGLVEKHGGHIRVRSSCGRRRGTVFTIFLPFVTEKAEVGVGSAA